MYWDACSERGVFQGLTDNDEAVKGLFHYFFHKICSYFPISHNNVAFTHLFS